MIIKKNKKNNNQKTDSKEVSTQQQKEEVNEDLFFDINDIDFNSRIERRQGDRRRGYRRIDDRNLVSRAQEEAEIGVRKGSVTGRFDQGGGYQIQRVHRHKDNGKEDQGIGQHPAEAKDRKCPPEKPGHPFPDRRVSCLIGWFSCMLHSFLPGFILACCRLYLHDAKWLSAAGRNRCTHFIT